MGQCSGQSKDTFWDKTGVYRWAPDTLTEEPLIRTGVGFEYRKIRFDNSKGSPRKRVGRRLMVGSRAVARRSCHDATRFWRGFRSRLYVLPYSVCHLDDGQQL
jgi:hypothetical protein